MIQLLKVFRFKLEGVKLDLDVTKETSSYKTSNQGRLMMGLIPPPELGVYVDNKHASNILFSGWLLE